MLVSLQKSKLLHFLCIILNFNQVTRGHSQRGLLTGRCPYAPKSEVPKAQPQDPHCTPDGMEELKGIYKKYCDLYGFKNNGDGNETVCIDPMNQHLTAEEIDAIENWTPKGMGPCEFLLIIFYDPANIFLCDE
jgi:hypothetical protein